MTHVTSTDLLAILGDRAPQLRILDVGALFEPGTPIAYARLLTDKRTTIIGFEPVRAECDLLNKKFGPMHKFFPYVIGDGGKALFHRCNFTMTSSLLEPDLKVMVPFQNLPEFSEVVEVSEVTTVRLDDIPEAQGADYIKLDVQGAEGQVLGGARTCLESALVIHTEVESVPIYEGQPLFGDIDTVLRSHGFMFHRMFPQGRTLRDSGFLDGENTRSQQLWADAVYIRPVTAWNTLSGIQILKLAVILDQIYASADFCACLVGIYDRREGTDFFGRYAGAVIHRVDPKDERVRVLEAELEAKERVVRELDQAARERLTLVNELHSALQRGYHPIETALASFNRWFRR
jgi:FkbM family methyltransferase